MSVELGCSGLEGYRDTANLKRCSFMISLGYPKLDSSTPYNEQVKFEVDPSDWTIWQG
ncbi:MAG: hypothetical protein MJA27_29060 [Pseudanabaenales cyanobacterium]|nr:hypothetical protein [Pseudanabaenales cyanobacterium]